MKLKKVESSNISLVGYDRKTKELSIVFRKRPTQVFVYPVVEESTYRALLNADSLGEYFHDNIRGLPFEIKELE